MDSLNQVQEFAGEEATALVVQSFQSAGGAAVGMRKYPTTTHDEVKAPANEKPSDHLPHAAKPEPQGETYAQKELALAFQENVVVRITERLHRVLLDQAEDSSLHQCLPSYGFRVEAIEKLHFLLAQQRREAVQEQFDEWLALRDKATESWRREQFLNGSSEEIIKSLSWIAEQGDRNDLILLLLHKRSAPYSSSSIQRPIQFAEDRLRVRIYETTLHQQIESKECFRLFCSPSQLERLPNDVYILDILPTFSLVLMDSGLAFSLKGYTVEALEPLVPHSNSLVGEKPMPMRDYIIRMLPQANGAWRKDLEEAGAQLLQPLGGTDYLDYIVTIPTVEAKQRVTELPEVRWIGAFQPQIHVNRQRFQEAISAGTPPILLASFFTAADCALAESLFQAHGIEIIEQIDETELALSVAHTVEPEQALDLIIAQVGLRALEEEAKLVLWNDVARHLLTAAEIVPFPVNQTPQSNADAAHLTGRGEIIAIADTGLDTGDKQTMHLDLQGRIRDWQSYRHNSLGNVVEVEAVSESLADYDGHGTHVTGSALGNGDQAKALGLPSVKGTAPEAELVFQAAGPGNKLAIPRGLKKLFSWAYDKGARIHSNSWGTQHPDYVERFARQLDEFVWTHKDFLVVVAAGNEAEQPDHHQPPSQKNVSSPGIAKNCLTVGACEHERPNLTITYGLWQKEKYSFEPARSHPMTDSPNHLASFSSRGPVAAPHDLSAKERRKPDVVAPGTFVLSTRSSQLHGHPDCWGAYLEGAAHYLFMSGTSMATPLIAGGVALVRQYLREYRGMASPSAALLKAAVIHSAQYLDQTEPPVVGQPGSRADDDQGWGLVKLSDVLAPVLPKRVEFFDESIGLQTAQDYEYQVVIADASVPLRVTLVYTDEPSSVSLVNHLNLWVCDPAQNEYWGNDFEGSQKPDASNNVEGVFVAAPMAGEWKVRVRATNVISSAGQDYALVLSGNLSNVKSRGIVKNQLSIN